MSKARFTEKKKADEKMEFSVGVFLGVIAGFIAGCRFTNRQYAGILKKAKSADKDDRKIRRVKRARLVGQELILLDDVEPGDWIEVDANEYATFYKLAVPPEPQKPIPPEIEVCKESDVSPDIEN